MPPKLAPLYEMSPNETVDYVETVAAGRVGIWGLAGTQASIASTTESKPMARGKKFLDSVLCADIGKPVDAALSAGVFKDSPDMTPREHFDQLLNVPNCAGCHKLINPIGISMESFNAAGASRTSYASGKPVETAYSGVAIPGLAIAELKNSGDLFVAAAASPNAWQCLVKGAFSYLTGVESEGRDPLLKDAYLHFIDANLAF